MKQKDDMKRDLFAILGFIFLFWIGNNISSDNSVSIVKWILLFGLCGLFFYLSIEKKEK